MEQMLEQAEATGGCGSGSCGCGAAAIDMTPAATTVPEVRINGRRLHIGPGEDLETVRERAWGEVLRQEAVRQSLLTDDEGDLAPTLSADQQEVIEDMLDAAVQTPEPTPEACQRYYDAHKPRFTHGQQAQLRHILFAVTPGVPVQKLAERAEAALLELTTRTHRSAASRSWPQNSPTAPAAHKVAIWAGWDRRTARPSLRSSSSCKTVAWPRACNRVWCTRAMACTSSMCWTSARASWRLSIRCKAALRVS